MPCACLASVAHHAQVRDAIYAAIRLPLVERHIRHEKHWKYVSNHTVQFWAKVSSRGHGAPEGGKLGLGVGWMGEIGSPTPLGSSTARFAAHGLNGSTPMLAA